MRQSLLILHVSKTVSIFATSKLFGNQYIVNLKTRKNIIDITSTLVLHSFLALTIPDTLIGGVDIVLTDLLIVYGLLCGGPGCGSSDVELVLGRHSHCY